MQQLSLYWSVDLDAAQQCGTAAGSPARQSSLTAWESGRDSEQPQHEDLVLQPVDCVLVLKMQPAGAGTTPNAVGGRLRMLACKTPS